MSNVTPIKGYTAQPQWKLDLVNSNKESEELLLRMLGNVGRLTDIDPRWLSIARTKFEEAYMALNRAVMNPRRIKLPEDDEG